MNALASLEHPADPTTNIDQRSSVEAMARTRHRRRAGPKSLSWEQTHPDYRDQMLREAAADFLVLSELLRPVLRQ